MPEPSAWAGRVRVCGIPSRHPGLWPQFSRGVLGGEPGSTMTGSRRRGRQVTLWGRREQCEVLDGLLADVRAERSRVLVVRGEPGIGKSALLGYAADTAQDFQVAQAEGVESEMELPYASNCRTGRPRRSWPAGSAWPARSR